MDNAISNFTVILTDRTHQIGRSAFTSRDIEFFEGATQIVGIFPETLFLVPTAPQLVFIKHTGTGGSSAIVDCVPTMDCYPQRIVPGASICLAPRTDTLYVKGETTTCELWVISASATSSPVDPGRHTGALSLSGQLSMKRNFERMHQTLSFAGNLLTEYLPTGALYVQFDINWHDSATINNGTDPLTIGEDVDDLVNGAFVSVYPSIGQWSFWNNVPPFDSREVGSTSGILDTWITIGMLFQVSGGTLWLSPRVQGVTYSPFDTGLTYITEIAFGATYSAPSTNFELDNFTIGTTGWGSSNIFSANFNDLSIVPPFDSIIGTGMDASGGTLSVILSTGDDTFAKKTITSWP